MLHFAKASMKATLSCSAASASEKRSRRTRQNKPPLTCNTLRKPKHFELASMIASKLKFYELIVDPVTTGADLCIGVTDIVSCENYTEIAEQYWQLAIIYGLVPMSIETTWTGAAGPVLLHSRDALAYFVQPNINPFYDLAANNHRSASSVQEGLRFVLDHSQHPNEPSPLHVVKKTYSSRGSTGLFRILSSRQLTQRQAKLWGSTI
jgi:hypothetical protein